LSETFFLKMLRWRNISVQLLKWDILYWQTSKIRRKYDLKDVKNNIAIEIENVERFEEVQENISNKERFLTDFSVTIWIICSIIPSNYTQSLDPEAIEVNQHGGLLILLFTQPTSFLLLISIRMFKQNTHIPKIK